MSETLAVETNRSLEVVLGERYVGQTSEDMVDVGGVSGIAGEFQASCAKVRGAMQVAGLLFEEWRTR
jgi:methylmalonyl-CoA mutase cobalamin-binding subunit